MKDLVLRVAARRFAEIIILNIIISVIVTAASLVTERIGIASNKLLLAVLMLGVLIFVIMNLLMLRRCYFDLINKKAYYISNFAAYLVFAAVNIALYAIGGNTVYTWLFAVTKAFRYISNLINTETSIIIFHLVSLIVIVFSPIGMEWLFDVEDDEYKKEY